MVIRNEFAASGAKDVNELRRATNDALNSITRQANRDISGVTFDDTSIQDQITTVQDEVTAVDARVTLLEEDGGGSGAETGTVIPTEGELGDTFLLEADYTETESGRFAITSGGVPVTITGTTDVRTDATLGDPLFTLINWSADTSLWDNYPLTPLNELANADTGLALGIFLEDLTTELIWAAQQGSNTSDFLRGDLSELGPEGVFADVTNVTEFVAGWYRHDGTQWNYSPDIEFPSAASGTRRNTTTTFDAGGYEEGTFTFTTANSLNSTVDTGSGFYTKIGNLVTLQGSIQVSVSGADQRFGFDVDIPFNRLSSVPVAGSVSYRASRAVGVISNFGATSNSDVGIQRLSIQVPAHGDISTGVTTMLFSVTYRTS